MNIFYAPPSQVQTNSIELKGQEVIHASKALRYRQGDAITVVDGVGGWYEGRVQLVTDQSIHVLVEKRIGKKHHHRPNTVLGMGIIKKRDRLEFAVEKAVELGVKEIALFRSKHTVKQNARLDRLRMIAISAMKQSLQAWLPEVRLFTNLDELLAAYNDSNMIIAHETEKDTIDQVSLKKEKNTLLLVGPEGGFSKHEINYFKEKGGMIVSLGRNRLRTETAAITLLSQFTFYGS